MRLQKSHMNHKSQIAKENPKSKLLQNFKNYYNGINECHDPFLVKLAPMGTGTNNKFL